MRYTVYRHGNVVEETTDLATAMLELLLHDAEADAAARLHWTDRKGVAREVDLDGSGIAVSQALLALTKGL